MLQLRCQRFPMRFAQVLFTEVETSLGKGKRLESADAQGIDSGGKLPFQAGQGGARLRLTAGMDQVRHGFRLGEVQPAVKKSPLAELAGTGRSCPQAHRMFEQQAKDEWTAMPLKFHHVLAGVAVRRWKIEAYAVVYFFCWRLKELAQIGVAWAPLLPCWQGTEGVGDGQGVGSGKTQNANTACAGGRGDGDDAVAKLVAPVARHPSALSSRGG